MLKGKQSPRGKRKSVEIEYEETELKKEGEETSVDIGGEIEGNENDKVLKSTTKKKIKEEGEGVDDNELTTTTTTRNGPKNWETVYHEIQEMRKLQKAPVDEMGCERLAENDQEDPRTYRFQTLISLMLSSQTKDQITAQAMDNLKKHGLTVDNVLKTDEKVIDKLIEKVGFHRRKAS